MVLGRGGNNGEIVYLLDDTNILIDGLKFDNASAVYLPTGGDIMGAAVGACPGSVVHLTDPNGTAIVNVGGAHIGCNTSFMRDTDGGATWVTDNHPTPGVSNTARGDNAFDYEYRLDGGVWTTMTKNGTGNDRTFSLNNCDADSVEFRVIVRNYQHVITGLYDNAGLVGSYFESPQTGRIAWNTIQGLGAVENEEVRLVSQKLPINTGASTYILQWSDYKRGMGSTSFTSTNECYERMTFTLTQNETITSAEVICSDYLAGINQVNVTPSSLTGLTYTLYDDIGDQSNLIRTNNTGIFVLGSGDIASVGYYVVVTGACNSVVATQGTGSFCLSDPPCPSITGSDIAVNGVNCGGTSATLIFTEDFEGVQGVGYTTIGDFVDATADDYFDLINEGTDPVSGVPSYAGASGNQFWAAEDTDDASNPNPAGDGTVSLTISGININNLTDVEILGLFAAGSANAYESIEYMHISAQVDGGGFNLIGAFESTNGGGSTSLSQDTNLDGNGDGTVLITTFQDFIFDLGTTGTNLDIQIEIYMSAGTEAVAFDNIRVQGVNSGAATCTVCPNDTLSFTITGDNLPGGGTIDWYSNTSSSFNPYNSEGEYIGSTQLPPSAVCVSSTLVFNEIMYRPSLNNGQDPNTGEYIELLGTPGDDIGCTVLTDGDWTITIPAGTTIPADGLFTIGNDAVYGVGTFDLDAENCSCFTDGFGGNGLLVFTDAGEYVSMFDATGTFTQGVIFWHTNRYEYSTRWQ